MVIVTLKIQALKLYPIIGGAEKGDSAGSLETKEDFYKKKEEINEKTE